MWAGPLCTHLLTRAGAVVTKIESAARPDGLRGSPMHRRLNDAKTVLDLDLRRPPDRREFDRLLAASDLLVTSLSLRALENFGLLPHQLAAAAPEAMTLAVTAFDAGSPEAGWIAYGTGVHAASGLGRLDDSARAQPPAWSYPDPLAGLRACAVAVEQLAARGAGAAGAHRHRRVSLAGAVRPLVEQARRCRAAADD
ncbi:MAG TPA: hypothetical protein DEP66_07360 [Acidimicrobiaceae bacterium]|nr:hypothetical protein [Acidimicrobiaceae bacterium]